MKIKVYLFLAILLLTSCSSQDIKEESVDNTINQTEIRLKEQNEEFKQLEAENRKLKGEVENLKERIKEAEDLGKVN